MKCQTENCEEKAIWGVQVLSQYGYRVAMCEDHAQSEMNLVQLPMDDPYVIPLRKCHWYRKGI